MTLRETYKNGGRIGWHDLSGLVTEYEQALAEKDRLHANQISEVVERLNDDYRAVLIGHEKAYQQLMAQAVRFAREWANPTGYASQVQAYDFIQSPEVQAFLKEREGTR